MAIKTFKFNYDYFAAEAAFKVDTDVFTNEVANETLTFFSWDYDFENDPTIEVLKKYAIESIRIATNQDLSLQGVIKEFDCKEGFAKVDGSLGLTLVYISGYDLDEEKLEITEI